MAFIIGLPSAANPGTPASVPAKNVLYMSNGNNAKFSQTNKSKTAVSLSDERRGMKFVNSYIRNSDERLVNVKERSEGPFAIIDSVLHRYNLPLQLKYLAVIESELKPTALSRVGAKGPWQLMPRTAHVLGLKVNRRSDERMNFYKSTSAAAKYLRDLHNEFGDWLLVLAAYNGGPRPVYRAIHKSHSRNFWALQNYLPAESREHVKKFIATTYYFEGGMNSTNSSLRAGGRCPTPGIQAISTPGVAMTARVSPKTSMRADETDNERFLRLMHESAESLKASHELLEPGN